MNSCAVCMLDNDKDFLKIYATLLQNKGCPVFATDNLFLLLKYVKTIEPKWVFIDEKFSAVGPDEIINSINTATENSPRYTVMSPSKDFPYFDKSSPVEYIYKPHALEKIIDIAENCCIIQ